MVTYLKETLNKKRAARMSKIEEMIIADGQAGDARIKGEPSPPNQTTAEERFKVKQSPELQRLKKELHFLQEIPKSPVLRKEYDLKIILQEAKKLETQIQELQATTPPEIPSLRRPKKYPTLRRSKKSVTLPTPKLQPGIKKLKICSK